MQASYPISRLLKFRGSSFLLIILAAPILQASDHPFYKEAVDVGAVTISGATEFEPIWNRYTLTAGGENMWGEKDAFHFAWTRIQGDFQISADIQFVGKGINPHRKACLIVRESLEPGSPYADAALHGDGLTSLQYRRQTGGPTEEVQSSERAPQSLKLRRTGNHIEMLLGDAHGSWRSVDCSIEIDLEEPLYLGLALCSHETGIAERAVFSNVRIQADTID